MEVKGPPARPVQRQPTQLFQKPAPHRMSSEHPSPTAGAPGVDFLRALVAEREAADDALELVIPFRIRSEGGRHVGAVEADGPVLPSCQ